MKNKILGLFMLFFGLLFISVFIGAIMRGLPELRVEGEGTGFNTAFFAGFAIGLLMMGLAIFVLLRNGIRYLKK